MTVSGSKKVDRLEITSFHTQEGMLVGSLSYMKFAGISDQRWSWVTTCRHASWAQQRRYLAGCYLFKTGSKRLVISRSKISCSVFRKQTKINADKLRVRRTLETMAAAREGTRLGFWGGVKLETRGHHPGTPPLCFPAASVLKSESLMAKNVRLVWKQVFLQIW